MKLKIRAWSALDNEMTQCDMEKDIQSFIKHDDGITLMQFIGMQDMCGTDIYEGDIIGNSGGEPIAIIEYHAPSFCYRWIGPVFKRIRRQKEPVFGNVDICQKVVGNVFQNSDLIPEDEMGDWI